MIGWSYGIDPDADGFALAVVNAGTGGLMHVERFELPDGLSDEHRTYRLMLACRERLVHLAGACDWPPALVTVEQPAGQYPSPKLMAGWTACTIAAVSVAGEAVAWMTPPAWQGAPAGVGILGRAREVERAALFSVLNKDRMATVGRAYPKSHPLRKETKLGALLRAREAGYRGLDDNEADAVCIALAGARRAAA